MSSQDYVGSEDRLRFDLYVRGTVPRALEGSLIIALSRRNKDRSHFARWHDSQTDLVRLDLFPGHPGRVLAHVLPIDPSGGDLPDRRIAESDRRMFAGNPAYGYATQPNHGINVSGNKLWATNLLFGAPLEIDIPNWRPVRILRYLELSHRAPRVSGTSHFAMSLDDRYVYFHQSLLEPEDGNHPVRSADLRLIELDVQSGSERIWQLAPPEDDGALETANFHSGFYFEEDGKRYVGLLRTGALLESLAPHPAACEHDVIAAPSSTIWLIELDSSATLLHAQQLPGIKALGGLALSHLCVDASGGKGFVLYANFKEADVAEETHGINVYGEAAGDVAEHYSGMVVEALNHGLVIRYERRNGRYTLRTFTRDYDPARTALGHSWLPINIQLSNSGRLFCSFNGFRPRLLPRHIACAYSGRVADITKTRFVPPALIRFDPERLEPDSDGGLGHITYAEPVAFALGEAGPESYVCTFSPEVGLRIYRSDDLSQMICRAESPNLIHWNDTHFRPDPAHMAFVHR